MKTGKSVDAPTTVPTLIYIHEELSLHISSSTTLASINWIPIKYSPILKFTINKYLENIRNEKAKNVKKYVSMIHTGCTVNVSQIL